MQRAELVRRLMQAKRIERITIDFTEVPGEFVFRVDADGEKSLFETAGNAGQVEGMLLTAKILVNTELGVPPPEFSASHLN